MVSSKWLRKAAIVNRRFQIVVCLALATGVAIFAALHARTGGDESSRATAACCASAPGAAGELAGLTSRNENIYERAKVEFTSAIFLKPLERDANDLAFKLAPLIVQEVGGATDADLGRDRFGGVSLSNGVGTVHGPPAVYYDFGQVQLGGRTHLQVAYVWFYPGTTGASTAPALPIQGVRLTLNSRSEPVIWEVLTETEDADLMFVAQSVEDAARTQSGAPLPGRKYTVERALAELPGVVVARVIDDGPMPMGPMLYLNAATRSVSTLICRCMPAQGKNLLDTKTYDLLPMDDAVKSAMRAMRERHGVGVAFVPGEEPVRRLEEALRLPAEF